MQGATHRCFPTALNFGLAWSAPTAQIRQQEKAKRGLERFQGAGEEESCNYLHGSSTLSPSFLHMAASHWHQPHYTLRNSLLTPLGSECTWKDLDRQGNFSCDQPPTLTLLISRAGRGLASYGILFSEYAPPPPIKIYSTKHLWYQTSAQNP